MIYFIIDLNRNFWNGALVSIELLRPLLSFRFFSLLSFSYFLLFNFRRGSVLTEISGLDIHSIIFISLLAWYRPNR